MDTPAKPTYSGTEVSLDWAHVSRDIETYKVRIGALDIDDEQRDYLLHRWLARLIQLKRRSLRSQRMYFLVRTVAIIGGLLIPALVSAKFFTVQADRQAVDGIVFCLSLLVATATSMDGFIRYGDQWRLYQRTAYELEESGWYYFTMSAWIRRYKTHREAHRHFVEHVEAILEEFGDELLKGFATAQQKKDGRTAEDG